MADWIRSDDADFVIAHLSDLHVGSRSCDLVAPLVRDFIKDRVKPDLLLVTGDVADTTATKHYDAARTFLESLSVPNYFICPGNHDRYPKGNRLWNKLRGRSSAINQKFAMHVLAPDVSRTIPLGKRKFSVGLVGMDSCEEVDFFARGFVPHEQLQQLAATLERDGKEWDLSIVLVHHHLQPVRALELDRKGSVSDLGAVTCLVNAGSVLEKLAKSNVDLVLHGHEHAAHWGRYGTLEGTRGEVRVLGAGSAFGNSSASGCSLKRATFNIITVRSNRSAFGEVVDYDGNSWRAREVLHLFDAATSRRMRLLRNTSKRLEGDVDSHVTKCVEFTTNRDIEIRWVLTNWFLESPEFRHPVSNSTGIPVDGLVTVESGEAGLHQVAADFERKGQGEDHAWICKAELPRQFLRTRCRLTFSYRWRSGALLTSSEMRIARETNTAGILRDQGHEFASVYAPGVMASAQLIVALPTHYAPVTGVDVRVFEDNREQRTEASELQPRVLVLSPGRYALTVPYPRQNWWYALTWSPVAPPPVADPLGFLERARRHGVALLKVLRQALPSEVGEQASTSLYVLDAENGIARTLGVDPVTPQRVPPPDQVAVRGDSSALGQGFWGVPIMWKRPVEPRAASELGFLTDEEYLWVIPVRFSLQGTASSPLAVVRLGFPAGAGIGSWTAEDLEKACGPAVLRILTWQPPADTL